GWGRATRRAAGSGHPAPASHHARTRPRSAPDSARCRPVCPPRGTRYLAAVEPPRPPSGPRRPVPVLRGRGAGLGRPARRLARPGLARGGGPPPAGPGGPPRPRPPPPPRGPPPRRPPPPPPPRRPPPR